MPGSLGRATARSCFDLAPRWPRTTRPRAAAGRRSARARLDAGKNCCGTKRNARPATRRTARPSRPSTVLRCATHQSITRAEAPVERRVVDARRGRCARCGAGARRPVQPRPRAAATTTAAPLLARDPAAACSRGTGTNDHRDDPRDEQRDRGHLRRSRTCTRRWSTSPCRSAGSRRGDQRAGEHRHRGATCRRRSRRASGRSPAPACAPSSRPR